MLREINGWRTRVLDFGSGQKTLVTHGGWTGSWELWEQQADALSREGWRVIAYDHRGSGFADVDVAGISLDVLVVHTGTRRFTFDLSICFSGLYIFRS